MPRWRLWIFLGALGLTVFDRAGRHVPRPRSSSTRISSTALYQSFPRPPSRRPKSIEARFTHFGSWRLTPAPAGF